MLVIGLTGGIGSGKTTVANLFAEKGITVIDTDQLSRDLTQPGQPALEKIIEKFGRDILNHDGTLNRSELRKKIFTDARDRIWLEKLLHPLIRQEMQRQIETAKSSYCIVVIPLLFETDHNPLINRVLVIDALAEHQIKRTQSRDNISQEAIEAILKAQVGREHRLEKADDIIHNHGMTDDLIAQVDKLHNLYTKLANMRSKK